MTKQKNIYKCEICGNIIEVLHEGGGILVCCGQPMKHQKENIVEASPEKHIPVIERIKEGVFVKVGSVEHPMVAEHHIEWIELSTETGNFKEFLKIGEKPEVFFPINSKKITARAYCNLHGLWKTK